MAMLNSKQHRVLESIFTKPERSDIRWSDVRGLIEAAGGEVEQRSGSRVLLVLNDEQIVLHTPHRPPVMDKGAVKTLRRFLQRAGLTP